MYWKVQKIGPEQLIRSYGVHILLAVSIAANGVLLATRPKTNVSSETKQTVEVFTRGVTQHLLDSSYINCEGNITALRKELAPNVLQLLMQAKELPANDTELMALIKDMSERKQTCSVRIDSVKTGDPTANGLIPVEVQGTCAIHSSSDTSEQPFRFQYLVGQHRETQAYLIAQFQNVSPQPAPQSEEGQ